MYYPLIGNLTFSLRCYHVVAIDIDPQKVKLAFNNAKIYGVEDYIDFIVGDFFQLAPSLKVMFFFCPVLKAAGICDNWVWKVVAM